jgi:hypothetical protein
MAVVGLGGVVLVNRAAAQATMAATSTKGKTAGQFFKNVTTTSLKGLSVDDFLGTMGVISADLGYDCADCHPGAGSDKVDWVIDTPKKRMARRMVEMVATINKTNFGGAQMVTCFTCHHGKDTPLTTIALDTLYSAPNDQQPDIISQAQGLPSADAILDKYIAAAGGTQKLAGLTSWIASGTSVGYEGLGGGGSFQIYAKSPDKRTVLIEFKDHPERGDSERAFNGTAGWIKSPRGLLGSYDVSGKELDGLKLDAELAFPGQIKKVFTSLRSGNPDSIDGKDVDVVQGNGPGGVLVTLYFDKSNGLLSRLVRYTPSPIGRIPSQEDYADYKEFDGIKFPTTYKFAWLDGRDQFKIDNVKVNAPIDDKIFDKPAGK